MPTISSVMGTAEDPLVVALVLFAVAGALSHFLFRGRPMGRAVMRVIFLIVLTVALLRAAVIPYEPLQTTGVPLRDAAHGALKIAWWLWAAWLLVAILRTFVIAEHRPREAKLIQDLLAGAVYLAAVFAIVAYVFDLPVQGLLATSGAIAIILGLALQSTLADVFSGIVLNFSRPYRPGDWINLEGGTDGRVIEMNWRATHVLTARRDLAIVPNSAIAKAKIVNASSPSTVHGMTVTVQLDARDGARDRLEILGHAVANCVDILAQPPPYIVVKAINAVATEIDITFFVEELAASGRAQSALFDLIYRHLSVCGIGLAAPPGLAYRLAADRSPPAQQPATMRVLSLVAIFATLTEDERETLAGKLQPHAHDKDDILVEPGNVVRSFFLVGSGVLSLVSDSAEGEIELMRLGPGDHFGEIGVLTGAPAQVTIRALSADDRLRADKGRSGAGPRSAAADRPGAVPRARPAAGLGTIDRVGGDQRVRAAEPRRRLVFRAAAPAVRPGEHRVSLASGALAGRVVLRSDRRRIAGRQWRSKMRVAAAAGVLLFGSVVLAAGAGPCRLWRHRLGQGQRPARRQLQPEHGKGGRGGSNQRMRRQRLQDRGADRATGLRRAGDERRRQDCRRRGAQDPRRGAARRPQELSKDGGRMRRADHRLQQMTAARAVPECAKPIQRRRQSAGG